MEGKVGKKSVAEPYAHCAPPTVAAKSVVAPHFALEVQPNLAPARLTATEDRLRACGHALDRSRLSTIAAFWASADTYRRTKPFSL